LVINARINIKPHSVSRGDKDACIHLANICLPALSEHLHPNQTELPGFICTALLGLRVVLGVGKADREAVGIGRREEYGSG
jgi:hypothetical protein